MKIICTWEAIFRSVFYYQMMFTLSFLKYFFLSSYWIVT